MSLTRFFYDPFFTVEDLNQLMDDGRFPASHITSRPQRGVTKPFIPRMDLHENAETNQLTATFELPGLKKSDVTIDIHNDTLVVTGETSSSSETNEKGYQVRERKSGKFSRSVSLPKGTKPTDITAKMEDGVLVVTFPKVQPDQAPARVTIA